MNFSDSPDRFTRTVDLYGPAGFERLRDAHVTVFGQGGVGAHAAVALARSGLGHLTIVDFDVISPSSLNRHPCATLADIDHPKTEVMATFLARTCPDTEVVPVTKFFHDDTADALLIPAPDHVIDAIDSLNPKTSLLEQCVRRGVTVSSSMGAAMRSDVSYVEVADLSETRICPLASRIRRQLRRRGITSGIDCVFSTEPTDIEPLPANEPQVVDRGRERLRLPSSITLPAIFGFALAANAIDRITGRTVGKERP